MPVHSGTCDRYLVMHQLKELREELRLKHLELAATKKLDMPGVIMVTSLISHRNQKPRVDIQVGEIHTQMDAAAAMNLAKNLIECATGAFADAFIFHFMKERLNQPDAIAGQIIQDFRDYRDKLAAEFEEYQEGRI